MLERYGKTFAFSPQEIGCVNPELVKLIVVFLYFASCSIELEAHSILEGPYSKTYRTTEREGENENS